MSTCYICTALLAAAGYAMTVYIPVSILCIIPVDWVHWMLVGLATAMSGGFLLMNLRKAVAGAHKGK